MIEYIKDLITTIQMSHEKREMELKLILGAITPDFIGLIRSLAAELDRLDPRDFEPEARHKFVVYRGMMQTWARKDVHLSNEAAAASCANKINELLNSYAGEGSRAKTRTFSFVTDTAVQKIVERDYRELVLRAFPDGSWKSTIMLSGSILEAVLYDMLTKNATAISNAMASTQAPKKKGGAVKDITKHDYEEQWTLNDLIKVACDLKLLPHKDEKAIHLVLREYRNFVHPRLEVKLGVNISEGHATASKGMLDVILDHLTP